VTFLTIAFERDDMFLIDGLQKKFQAQPVLAGDIRARQVRQSQPNTLINLLRELRVPTSLQQLQQAIRHRENYGVGYCRIHSAFAIEFHTRTYEQAPQAYGR
jgi:hypothetical protein